MQSRIKTLTILVSCLCACTSETNQVAKTVASGGLPVPADSVAAADAPPPAPVVAPRSFADTAAPRTFVDTTAWLDPKHTIDTTENAPSFQCAPAMFTEADTLTLRINAPHGDWLSVKRPDESVFYLVAPSTGSAPNYSIVPSDSFPNKVMLRFLGGLVTRPGPDGNGNMTAVFNQPGHYEFRVGGDLASHRPRDVRECTIRLVPLSRY
jgi:hypothetical protein